MTQPGQSHLIERMPPCRGRLSADAPLAQVTWFRVGGPAEVLFRPADADDLAGFLERLPADIPVTLIGVASNLLIRDGGIPGVTIRLGRGFTDIARDGDTLTVGAAALDLNVAVMARDAGLAGLEFLSGIPGTIGGALRMNGGAYGQEMADVLLSAQAVGRDGARLILSKDAMGFTYRHSGAPEDCVFTAAVLRGVPGDREAIAQRMAEIAEKRADSQPVRSRTGGSTFKNPPGHKAWELIDRAGCRGLSIGDAQVSELHCNFLINRGSATAADLEGLGEEVRRRVFDHSGVTLDWEIKRVGIPGAGAAP
ncbi:UDP-N-acetylmuramate dehydrogenase [Azospirillum griseum]|uniref:UDP-N-acetylenolpyruvoylglucosamine reductase n=1 Tax=Azospirillum griseum TaxID=2496639 RepID=A0A3S0R8E5_9PROT|nr:UDP-N-acetylmuramate dehydrogenase [Azospirillum griseum]RTR19231.1 UDP-N-acetylmuramate dehydrogenase [Azospirillum griseum]